MSRALVLAFIFLTRIPLPVRFEPEPVDWGRSVAGFPIVGLAIGIVLVLLSALLANTAAGVVAVILLALWALITGGLHLDGLADAADAWIGGFGDREKSLRIMKDPRCGPIAVVVVVLVLLGKFAALQTLVAQGAWAVLLITPVLGRGAILLILLTTPYVRPEGVGVAHAEYLPRDTCQLILLGIGILVLGGLGWQGAILLIVLGLGLQALRKILLQRLGGATGDTLGAACELTEVVSLLTLAALSTP